LGNRSFGIKVAHRALVQYNHVHNHGYLNPDAGLFYVNHQGKQDLAHSEVSYNILHDFIIVHPGNVGLYLDNGSSGYSLHHNVIWNVHEGIRFRAALELFIYNNTLVDVDLSIVQKKGPYKDDNIFTQNNLSTVDGFDGTTATHNQVVNVSDFTDHAGRDYSLKLGVAAIDAGTHVEWITADVVGAPDLGAYEFGKPKWTAGSNIQVPNSPDEEAGWDAMSNGVK